MINKYYQKKYIYITLMLSLISISSSYGFNLSNIYQCSGDNWTSPWPIEDLKEQNNLENSKQLLKTINRASKDRCSWHGITCYNQNAGKIKRLLNPIFDGIKSTFNIYGPGSVPPYEIKKIDLSHNNLEGDVKHWGFQFYYYEELNLSNNNLYGKIGHMQGFRYLKKFNISHNNFDGPIYLFGDRVEDIDVSYNNFDAISIGRPSIKNIDVSNNNLKTLDVNMGYGSEIQLTSVIFDDNKISSVHSGIGSALRLRQLIGDNNLLTHLPSSLENCINLSIIILQYNQFQKVPEVLFSIPSLIYVDLTGNPIAESDIPENIGGLRRVPGKLIWSPLFRFPQ